MAARELRSGQTLTCEWSNARTLFTCIEDTVLEAVKDPLLDGHMKSALNGNLVASSARGSDPTSGDSIHAERDASISSIRLQIRAWAAYMHLSLAIVYSRSIITSALSTAASFRYRIKHFLRHICRVTCAHILTFQSFIS